jgi:phosphoglycerate dehydrogenase-like enzyme
MIRILIADDLSTRTVDKLNEIPEFEISENTDPGRGNFAAEIKNVDALVGSGAILLPAAFLESAVNLKIIIVTGGADLADSTMAMARRKNIEVHSTRLSPAATAGASAAEKRELEGSDVIAILKDFFNV